MCGIAGIYSHASNPVDMSHMAAALRSLQHRGPDGEHSVTHDVGGGTCILGHRRLAIIDLSQDGIQPMTSCNGRYIVTFNGEIYNYRELKAELQKRGTKFKTDTDTEVLLEAWSMWGADCLPRLIGMFSFVIKDREHDTLECVRDAFGIKPLFYEYSSSHFAFASEIDALRRLMPKACLPNAQRAFDYLALGHYDDNAETFFDGVYNIEPGCRLTVHLGEAIEIRQDRWWRPPVQQRNDLTFKQTAEQIREQFLTSVRLHLRSDVPLSAALSGGIDSSAIVCAMRHLKPEMEIHTFSYIAGDGAVNEENWIDMINDHVGAVPHKVTIGEGDLFKDIDDLIIAHGEPFGSTSIYGGYRIFKSAREAGIVVCLDGQGADEIYSGYQAYVQARLLSLFEQRKFTEIWPFLSAWTEWPGRKQSYALQLFASEFLPQKFHSFARQFIGRNVIKPWLNLDSLQDAGVRLEPYPFAIRSPECRGRRLSETLRSAISGAGLSRLLRHNDRNSMRWSIESRVPFLTTTLAEKALSLPESFLLSNSGETKSVFREAMRGIVPDYVIDRRDKVGFQTPELKWLNAEGLDLETILEPAAEIPFLDIDRLKIEVSAILDGEVPFTWQAWRIINYCKWAGLILFR